VFAQYSPDCCSVCNRYGSCCGVPNPGIPRLVVDKRHGTIVLRENGGHGSRASNSVMTNNDLSPSAWVRRFASVIPAGGAVLDLACGSGRHARLFASLGYRVEAVDRDEAALRALRGVAGVVVRCVDLEGDSWPFDAQSFDGVVVTNYLHRPRFDSLLELIKPGGVLIYETFMMGNEALGKPSNPDFLLRPAELLERVAGRLSVAAFEQGRVLEPKPAVVQRICAIRGDSTLLP
jgi:SAM-dependent methyltransferase